MLKKYIFTSIIMKYKTKNKINSKLILKEIIKFLQCFLHVQKEPEKDFFSSFCEKGKFLYGFCY